MIDIHAHILPGVDDGSYNLKESLDMLEIAVKGGTKILLATPHGNMPDRFPYNSTEHMNTEFIKLQRAVMEENIPIKLFLGMEIFLSDDMSSLLKQGKLFTINQGKYILVECDFEEDPDYFDYILTECFQNGFHPIIAHPERYYFAQDYPDIVERWFKKGYGIQINKNSLVGAFGKEAEETAFHLLEHECVSCIASDAHSAKYRTPYMKECKEILLHEFGYQYTRMLLEQNPYRILHSEPLLTLDDIYIERK